MEKNVYIKLQQKTTVFDKKVHLKEVADVVCNDDKLEDRIKNITLIDIKKDKEHCYSFSVTSVINKIQQLCGDVNVINLGETDFIVDYLTKPEVNRFVEFLKVAFISLVVFLGSAFTIMTFNTDVSVGEQFEIIYTLLLGHTGESMNILEITYSIGIGGGMIIFFNHYSRKKTEDDPTPVQIEMCSYEKDICGAIVNQANKNGKLIED